MFGTWKYDPETDEVQNLRQAFDPITARSSQHQACNRCHEKKLKCSGEKDGCERCITNQLSCEYTRSSSRGSRRGKKTHRRSAEMRGREDSPVQGRPVSQASSDTISRHRSPRQGMSPLPSSSSAYSNTASASHHEPHQMLDQLDFSLLTPASAFDLGTFSDTSSHVAAYNTFSTSEPSNSAYVVSSASMPSMVPAYSPYHQPFEHHHPSVSPQPNLAMDYSSSWTPPPPHPQAIDPALTSAAPPHPNTVTAGQDSGYPAVPHGGYHVFPPPHAQGFHDSQYWPGNGGH